MFRRLAIVALSAASAVPAVAAEQEADGPATALAEVQALLDARVQAVISGDRGAWMATVDPEAPDEFRQGQERSFDGLRALPLASYALTARLDDTGDLSTGLEDRYGGARVFLPETRQTYRLEGYDDRDAIDTLWLTFVARAGRWYVGGDRDLSALGLDTARNLWDLGPVRVHPTEHFLVLSRPQQAERADALAGMAEQAIEVLEQRWDQPWSKRIPMVLPASVEELEVMLQTTFDLDNFVAFVVYGANRDEGFAATAPRIYLQDRNLSSYDRTFQVETLVHELVHAASVPLAGPFIPAWVHEATADWLAKGRSTTERPPKGSDGQLPRDFEFSIGGGAAIVRSYAESRSAASWLAGRFGERAPTRFLQRLGRPRVAPGSVDYHVDTALRDTVGAGFDDIQRMWAGQ